MFLLFFSSVGVALVGSQSFCNDKLHFSRSLCSTHNREALARGLRDNNAVQVLDFGNCYFEELQHFFFRYALQNTISRCRRSSRTGVRNIEWKTETTSMLSKNCNVNVFVALIHQLLAMCVGAAVIHHFLGCQRSWAAG